MIKSPFRMINLLSGVYWFDEALQAALKASGIVGVTLAQSPQVRKADARPPFSPVSRAQARFLVHNLLG